jgi:hypothetical protein
MEIIKISPEFKNLSIQDLYDKTKECHDPTYVIKNI